MTDLQTDPNIDRLLDWIASLLLDMVLFVIDVAVYLAMLLASAYATFKICDAIVWHLEQAGQDILASNALSFGLVIAVLALCQGALYLAWGVIGRMLLLLALRLATKSTSRPDATQQT